MFRSFSGELMEVIYGPHSEIQSTPGTVGGIPHAGIYWNAEKQVLCQEVESISMALDATERALSVGCCRQVSKQPTGLGSVMLLYHHEKSMPRLACCPQGEGESCMEQSCPSQGVLGKPGPEWSLTHGWAG